MNEHSGFKVSGVFRRKSNGGVVIGYAEGCAFTVGEDDVETDDEREAREDVPEPRGGTGKRRQRLAAARRLLRGVAKRGAAIVRATPQAQLATSAARIVSSASRDDADLTTMLRLGVNPRASAEEIRDAVGGVSDVAIGAYKWVMGG